MYVTGDVSRDYLDRIERVRNDTAKQEKTGNNLNATEAEVYIY